MNAVRFLLMLSVVLNVILAIALGWQMSLQAPSSPPPVTSVVMSPSMPFLPRLDVNEPPKIIAGGYMSPYANVASTVVAPVRVEKEETAADREREERLKLVRDASHKRHMEMLSQPLLQMESGEFAKPNIMWQTPPASKLKPGRSTPFSTPRWDEHPVLKHGEP